MKKLAIGCGIALALLVVAGLAAWKFLPPLIERAYHSALNQAQNAAMDRMGMAQFGSTTGTAYLTDIEGEVYVTHEGKRDEAVQGPVAEGDMIETKQDSSVAVIWPDYGRTLVDENSKLTITQADKSGSSIKVEMNLDVGRIWTRLERLLSTGSNFEVRSSNVVATVRGTSFGVDHRVSGNVNIQVAESKVGVQKMRTAFSDDPVGEIVLSPGQQAQVDESIMTSMPKPTAMTATMMNDPFIMQGNAKIDTAYMSWISKAMELYNSIPQDREMTEAEAQALEEKAMELWTTLPPEYQNQDTIDQVIQ